MAPRGRLVVLLLVVGCSARPQEEVATSASDETAADPVVTDTTIVNDFVVSRVGDNELEKGLELEPVPQTTAATAESTTQASEPAPLTTAKSSEPSPLTTAKPSEPSPLTTARSSEPVPQTTASLPPSDSPPSTLTEEPEDETDPDPSTNIIKQEALPISLRITIMPEQNLRFRPGRVFSLECDAYADTPGEIDFAWTKDGVFIKPGGHIIRESRNNGRLP